MFSQLRSTRIAWRLALGIVFVSAGSLGWSVQSTMAADPSACLYDAPEQSAVPLTEAMLSEQNEWSRLDEDNTAHRFQGCCVLLNDKLVAVLAKDTPNVDVYSRQTRGLKLCARLQPLGGSVADFRRTSLTIEENSASRVAMNVAI